MFGLKIWEIIILIAIIVGAVGYHFITLHDVNTQLDIERRNNLTLSDANGKLTVANQNLSAAVQEQKAQFNTIVKEITAIHEADNRASETLQRTNDFLSNAAKQSQLQKLRAAPNNAPLKNLLNQNADCEFRHITEAGKCTNGQFVPAK